MKICENGAEVSSSYSEYRQTRKPTLLLWLFVILFSLRVLGQALQRWTPQSYLPPFDAFQGSRLPYWLLLLVQLVILAVMVRYSIRIQRGTLRARLWAGKVLAWIGGIYMMGALTRIVIGLALPTASAWFSTWIPAFFHVVLAGYVLALSCYHIRFSKIFKRESSQ